MQVHLFRGPGREFGFTADPTGANLSAEYAPWTAIKVVELKWGEQTPGVDADECLDEIDELGVHVTDAHARITDEAIPPSDNHE